MKRQRKSGSERKRKGDAAASLARLQSCTARINARTKAMDELRCQITVAASGKLDSQIEAIAAKLSANGLAPGTPVYDLSDPVGYANDALVEAVRGTLPRNSS